MEKEFLEKCLEDGMSLDQIGEESGRSSSTVSYHLRKHGLKPLGRDVYAARGPVSRKRLAELVAAGNSIREIARLLDRSPSTVRYWLKRFGTGPTNSGHRRTKMAEARDAGIRRLDLECRTHGVTEFILDARGTFRCVKCNSTRVSDWRRRTKLRLVDEAGGKCVVCGYGRCPAALHFHHLDPSQKEFSLSREGVTRSIDRARAEAAKCALLCANCHAEVEAGLTSVAMRAGR